MKKISLTLQAFFNSLGVIFYVALVSWIMVNGEKFFGKMDNYFGPLALLMLFVFSALVVGVLVLGKPILLILDDKKKEALKMFFTTFGWLFVLLVVVFITLIITK